MKMRGRAPAYRGNLLHFDALRFVELRGGGRGKETLTTENEGKCLYAHLRTCTQPRQPFAAGTGFQPTPGPLCELA